MLRRNPLLWKTFTKTGKKWRKATGAIGVAPEQKSSSGMDGGAAAPASVEHHFQGTSYRTSTGKTIPTIEQQLSRGSAKERNAFMRFLDDATLRVRGLSPDGKPNPNSWFAGLEDSLLLHWARLIRLDKPAGTLLLLMPCYWGTAMAVTKAVIAEGADPVVLCAPFIPLHLLGMFAFGAWTMRSAGCIINDMWDRDFDRKVERTKNRPLASGKVTMTQAAMMLSCHLVIGATIAIALHPVAMGAALAAMPLVIIYPLMKRVTYGPQVVLGMAFNWGIFVGYAAVLGRVDPLVCVPLWIAGVAWTVIYDTIYAYQDVKDDEKAGVKSLTQVFGESKAPLQMLLLPMFAGFGISGLAVGQSFPYYCGFTFVLFQLNSVIDHFNIRDGWSCHQAFKRNVRIGFYFFLSMCLGNVFWVIYSYVNELKPTSKMNTMTKGMAKALAMNVSPAGQPYAASLEFRWLDRLLKPAFVHMHMAKKNGEEDPVIPPYMRREYGAQNVASFCRWAGLLEESTISSWEKWWYSLSDHYTLFGKL